MIYAAQPGNHLVYNSAVCKAAVLNTAKIYKAVLLNTTKILVGVRFAPYSMTNRIIKCIWNYPTLL